MADNSDIMGQVLTTREAAAYLGLAVPSLKHHVYIAKDLTPDRVVSGRLLFTRDNLDEFRKRKRPGGRPKQVKTDTS